MFITACSFVGLKCYDSPSNVFTSALCRFYDRLNNDDTNAFAASFRLGAGKLSVYVFS